jgi:protein gp37
MAARLAHIPGPDGYYGEVIGLDGRTWNGKTALVESALEKPLHWRKPCRVFVGSMTDLFHPSTPFEWLDKIFTVMALRPQITFQLLTKRPERMRKYLTQFSTAHYHQLFERTAYQMFGEEASIQVENSMNGVLADGYNVGWPLSNVWLGVTVENQAMADQRIPILLNTPAAVRFVSIEPMLGPVRLDNGLGLNGGPGDLDWVICGGETGPRSRHMENEWAFSIRDRCVAAGVPFFFKKWGDSIRISKENQHTMDKARWEQFPQENGG